MDWQKILTIIAAIAIAFWLFQYIRTNKQALSRENISKGFWTLGLLALGLVGFIGFLIVFLRSN